MAITPAPRDLGDNITTRLAPGIASYSRENETASATLQRLFEMRDPLYREIADLVIQTDGRNARVLAREIEDHIDRPATAL